MDYWIDLLAFLHISKSIRLLFSLLMNAGPFSAVLYFSKCIFYDFRKVFKFVLFAQWTRLMYINRNDCFGFSSFVFILLVFLFVYFKYDFEV